MLDTICCGARWASTPTFRGIIRSARVSREPHTIGNGARFVSSLLMTARLCISESEAEMRIRTVKPIFWRDRELARLGDEARLFYIGLWMQADDAGTFRWNPDEIAADLYPYQTERSRLGRVERYREALASMPGESRLTVYDCGHAVLTRFAQHQKFAGEGKRVYTFAKEHEACPRVPAVPRASPRIPATDGIWEGNKEGIEEGKADTREGALSKTTKEEPTNSRTVAVQRIDKKLADPNLVPEYRKELEAERARLLSAA